MDRWCARGRRLGVVLLAGVAWSQPAPATPQAPYPPAVAVQASDAVGAMARLRDWQRLIASLPAHARLEQLHQVNRFVNAVPFVEDAVHWGQEDYWATPAELFASNGGDCEDLAIAKYFTLRAAGVPREQLRLTYVRARSVDRAHMVLAVYPGPAAEPLVLDNLDPQIKPASQRPDLEPVYSFNGDSLWIASQLHDVGRRVGAAERIGRWRRLLARMKPLRGASPAATHGRRSGEPVAVQRPQ